MQRNVAPATQNKAKSALLFVCREVLGVQLRWLGEIVAANDKRRLQVMLTATEGHGLLVRDGKRGKDQISRRLSPRPRARRIA